ncbi:hypothetical protein Golomagni_05601 [Golovinomyces magnicellulatus]|nr:hypothetical protein Golomagni_05601 [Golovinomyces magnicellulatus]
MIKAINKLNVIRQGNQDFRDFLQDFEKTIPEAQGWSWEDQIKKGYLHTALNRELNGFVSQLRKTSDKMKAMNLWNNRRNRDRYLLQKPSQILDNGKNADPID